MKIRINSIGAIPPSYLGKPPEDVNLRISIVKYGLNHYYGKLQDYLDDGWEDLETKISKGNSSIDKNCFKREETSYVVASLVYCVDEECTELKTVGERLLDLSEDDRKDFFTVYDIAAKMLRERELVK